MNWAGVINLTLWLVIISVTDTFGQKEKETFESATLSNARCSLVAVLSPTSDLGSGTGESVFPLEPDYTLVCESLPTTQYSQDTSSLLPTSVFFLTTVTIASSEPTLTSSSSSSESTQSKTHSTKTEVGPSPTTVSYTFQAESILTTFSSLLQPSKAVTTIVSSTSTTSFVEKSTFVVPSTSITPIPSSVLEESTVEMRVILSEEEHLRLQDSESPERAALEAALVEEYLRALNSSSNRRKRQTQSSVTAEITYIGPRNSTTGETPISFYIIDGSVPVPAATVVEKLDTPSFQQIGGYQVLSIVEVTVITTSSASLNPTSNAISPFDTTSESTYPSVDSPAALGMTNAAIGTTVAVVVVVCCAAVLLAALLAYGVYRKVSKRKFKNHPDLPGTMQGVGMLERFRAVSRQDQNEEPQRIDTFGERQLTEFQESEFGIGEGLAVEGAITNQPGSSAVPFFPLLSKRHSSSVVPTPPSWSAKSSQSQITRPDQQQQQ